MRRIGRDGVAGDVGAVANQAVYGGTSFSCILRSVVSISLQWSVVGMSSLLLFLRHAGLFTALYRLPSTRYVSFHYKQVYVRLTALVE